MKLYWQFFIIVASGIIKENLCVPAIRPLSQRGIIFPEDNWDDCFLDNTSSQPGVCKLLEECPIILDRLKKENKSPKTCYFIKMDQYVCCPLDKTKQTPFTINKNSNDEQIVTTKKPFNIFLEIFNTEPTTFTKQSKVTSEADEMSINSQSLFNIFSQNITTNTENNLNNMSINFTVKPKLPIGQQFIHNIFLQNLTTTTDNILHVKSQPSKETSDIATIERTDFSSIFSTQTIAKPKRPSEFECDLQSSIKNDGNGLPSFLSNEFPFVAAIGWKIDGFKDIWYACGGLLISPTYVLTAAHCVDINGENPSYVYLRGSNNLTTYSNKDAIKIKNIITHPDYIYTKISNDIALVELEREVNNTVACLWTEPQLPLKQLTSLGFAHSTFVGLNPSQLVKSIFGLVDKNECLKTYEFIDKSLKVDNLNGILCAKVAENVGNTCLEGSDSVLIMEFNKVHYVVGVAAINLVCDNDKPTIYTKAPSHIGWIESIIWPEIDQRFT